MLYTYIYIYDMLHYEFQMTQRLDMYAKELAEFTKQNGK